MPNYPINNVLNLPINRLGRDFLVGDLCGQFEMLLTHLRTLKFDPDRDRVFHVGHLVAGGGSMTQCIRFLRQIGVFALRTNAEQQLLDLFEEGEPDDAAWASVAQAYGEAGAWLVDASRAQRHQVVDTIRMLPLAIGIGDRKISTGLVHGALPAAMAWREFSAGLTKGDSECVSAALWGGQEIPSEPIADVDEVFVCYTPDWNLEYMRVNVRQVMPGVVPQLLNATDSAANENTSSKEK